MLPRALLVHSVTRRIQNTTAQAVISVRSDLPYLFCAQQAITALATPVLLNCVILHSHAMRALSQLNQCLVKPVTTVRNMARFCLVQTAISAQ